MGKRNIYINLIVIIVLAFFSLSLVFSGYLNKGIDRINNFQSIKIPHFPDIPFKLGLDLQGGTHLVYEADLSTIGSEGTGEPMEGLRDVIERRVNVFGVAEPIIAVQQTGIHYRLIVELPGVKDVGEAINMIGKTPLLEFKEQREQEDTENILAKQKEIEGKTFEEYQDIENWQLAFEDPYFQSTKLRGQYLKKASLGFEQTVYEPQVLLEFNDEGADIFKEITSRNIGKILAIYIDNIPISAPVVQDEISGGKAQISGSFTVDEAKELARNLQAGALPVPITLISQTTIGPTLGLISLQKSLKAGLFGFLAIVLFISIFYRVPGILASLALIIYAGIVLSLFKLIPVTLTLASIGGAILSIGMAVDANVLIFERMKEERRAGESFTRALTQGFSRAWPSIRDGNLTTLIVAAIMFGFGSSFVKGFALTLSLGILTSLFSALFITKTFLKIFINTRLENVKWLWS